MANPRKFSEKIALHNHRQAEETAAFEKIMKEVSQATTKESTADGLLWYEDNNLEALMELVIDQGWRLSASEYITDILEPHVSPFLTFFEKPCSWKVAPDRSSSKNTLRISTQALGSFRGGSLPNVSAGAPSARSPPHNSDSAKDDVPHHNKIPSYRGEGRSRARSQGGPIRRPHDRRLDTSPYSTSPYLSPPTDTGWRRTNSDSALHQSTMQGMVDRTGDNSNRGWNIPMMNGPDRNPDGRPRSSCDIPSSRVPGISIHHSPHDPSMIQIPIGNNTGSLPDLTNVDFSSPIHAPIDQDHDSSPYSSSPVNTSPSTLSPTSIPQGVRPQSRFHFSPVSHAHSNQLTVPFSPRYQQHQQNIQLDKNIVNLVDTNFTTLQGITGIYQQQCPPTSSSPTLQQSAGYRSPRPSPQSPPSPGGRHSAPCSPGAPSPNEYHMLNQQSSQFQQNFEQLSMDWAQLVASLMESGCTWSAQLQLDPPNSSYIDQTTGVQQMTQTHPSSTVELNSMGNIEITPDAGYYSTSPSQQQVYKTNMPGIQTTPNTPNSLPEIILTDFSGDEGSRQDSFSRQLAASEFFTEEMLREGLGSLNDDEFQILANPSYSISEIVEDNFMLDHRS